MSDATLTTTFDAFYAAVLGTLRTAYGERIRLYAPFDPETMLAPEGALDTPALLLQVEGLEADEQTDRRAVRQRNVCRVAVALHLILSSRTTALQIALDVFASSIHTLIRQPDEDARLAAHPGHRWGLGAAVTPASRVVAMPGEWQPGLQGYDSRVIRWEQLIYLPDDPIACLAEPEPEPAPDPETTPDPDPDPEAPSP